MTGKSLLFRLRKKKAVYSFVKQENKGLSSGGFHFGVTGHMEGKYRSSSSNGSNSYVTEAPPLKKRRTEEKDDDEDDGLWDDSLELTQADFEDLEVQASQAYVEPVPKKSQILEEPQQSTSRMGQFSRPREMDTSGTFVKPQLYKSSSSISSSSSHDHSSEKYPSSLSGYSTSSSSIKSESSGELAVGHSRMPTHTRLSHGHSSEGLDNSMPSILGRQTSATDENKKEMENLQKRFHALDQELKQAQGELCVKQGENKLLRDNLHKRDSEIDHLKSEKVNYISKQNREQADKEKSLATELSRLQTLLQFKEQEQRDLEEQLRRSKPVPQTSQVTLSPKPVRVVVDERSPKASQGFPTKEAFLALKVSPQKAPVARTSKQTVDTSKEVKHRRRRKAQLQVSDNERKPTGPLLVAKLLEVIPGTPSDLTERGLVGLLQTPVHASLQDVQFDRDQNSSLLSPVRNKRSSEVKVSKEKSEDKFSVCDIVSTEHFNMAMQGLTSLLRTSKVMPIAEGVVDPGGDNLDLRISVDMESALLLLPLLNSYFSHYLEMLSSSTENLNVTNPSNASSSWSFDSSIESLTSSLGLLLRESTVHANRLEQSALIALKSLRKLVIMCQAVRNTMLHRAEAGEIATEGISTSAMQVDSSSSDSHLSNTELRHGGVTEELPQSTVRKIRELQILHKVFKLANPGSKNNLYNNEVVKVALAILTELSSYLTEDTVQSLLPVVQDGSIQNCLDIEGDNSIRLHALQLLTVLSRQYTVVSTLCSIEDCLLRSVYRLCSDGSKLVNLDREAQVQVYDKILGFLSTVVGRHKGGVAVLVEADCHCSFMIIQSVVYLLNSIIKEPNIDEQTTSLDILQKGLLLLHILWLHDTNFHEHHSHIQHEYVSLICGLTPIFKYQLQENDNEMAALADLWDFDQDDSELSQESGEDEQESSMEEA